MSLNKEFLGARPPLELAHVKKIKKNYEAYNSGERFQLFARKIRHERSKGNHFLTYLLLSIHYLVSYTVIICLYVPICASEV